MTAKEYLSQARRIEERVRFLTEQVKSLKVFSERCTSEITGMPKAENKSASPLADTVCKIVDAERCISDEVYRLIDKWAEISGVINSVRDTDCAAVLSMRYLSYKSWDEIANAMRFSKRWVHNTHSRALDMVQNILDTKHDNMKCTSAVRGKYTDSAGRA